MNISKKFSFLLSTTLFFNSALSLQTDVAKDALNAVARVAGVTTGYCVVHDFMARGYLKSLSSLHREYNISFLKQEIEEKIAERSFTRSCKAGLRYGLAAGFLTAFVTQAGHYPRISPSNLVEPLAHIAVVTGACAAARAAQCAYYAKDSNKDKSCAVADATALKVATGIGLIGLGIIAYKRINSVEIPL